MRTRWSVAVMLTTPACGAVGAGSVGILLMVSVEFNLLFCALSALVVDVYVLLLIFNAALDLHCNCFRGVFLGMTPCERRFLHP